MCVCERERERNSQAVVVSIICTYIRNTHTLGETMTKNTTY